LNLNNKDSSTCFSFYKR